MPHSRRLRKCRVSHSGRYYFVTTAVSGRRPIFTNPHCATIVMDALHWLDEQDRFAVDAAVVMPDHLHFAGRLGSNSLDHVMHSLKSFTANQLARTGVDSPVWQDGYYDHALRHDEDWQIKISYLIDNPRRSGLVSRAEDYAYLILPEGW